MLKINYLPFGYEIQEITSIDFSKLNKLSNKDVLKFSGKEDVRLESFMSKKMGIENRYWVDDDTFAYDLAKEALNNLVNENDSIPVKSDFLIFCGISNSLPTVCHASLLACEFGFKKASCFDLKSGCSSGVLGLIQALMWFEHGASEGIIVCSETLSKFSDKNNIQASGSVGDGAIALRVTKSMKHEIVGALQGTDPEFFKTMYVHGKFPKEADDYCRDDYLFTVSNNASALERSQYHWNKSLLDSLALASIQGEDISHYLAHQVDGVKNPLIARKANIPEESIYSNFKMYGNIGCPSVFLNYLLNRQAIKNKDETYSLLHAVGGGQSWASVIQRKK